MKHGRIIVEGLTDCYFIHQVVLKRFADLFVPVYDAGEGKDFRYPVGKDDPDEVFSFVAKSDSSVTLEIRDNGGSSKMDVLKGLLRDESGESRDFHTCVIFDADFAEDQLNHRPARGNGGFDKARETFRQVVPEADLYLFPNNRGEGMLESLLADIANRTKSVYFDTCWPAFTKSLAQATPSPSRTLSSKTELADYVEAYGRKISERKSYLQNLRNDDLWDYSAPALDPLVKFLAAFFVRLAGDPLKCRD